MCMSVVKMREKDKRIHVGCGAHILNEKNQILLMKRSKNCKNQVGCWTVPGGKVEYFETVEDAIKREVKEELGVDIEVIQLLSVTDDILPQENQHWVSPQFLCKIKSGVITNKEPHKCDDIQWFDIHEIPEKITLTTKDGTHKLKERLFQNKKE